MDLGPSAVAPQAVPISIADTRPTADAAAITKTNEPALPFAAAPFAPPNSSQSAAVSRSAVMATGVEPADKTRSTGASEEAVRTLKPYGITMLPDRSGDQTAAPQQGSSTPSEAQETPA